MALFPQSFLDDLKAQTDIVSVIGDVVPLKKAGRDVEGALSVPSGEDTRRSTSTRTRASSSASAAAPAATSSSSSSCTRSCRFPRPCGTWRSGPACRYRRPRADRKIGRRRPSARRSSSSTRRRRRSSGSNSRRPAGARARRELESRGLTAETIETFGYGYAPAGRARDTACAGSTDRKGPGGPPDQERPGRRAGRRADRGPVPEPADDPDRAGFRRRRGVWGPGARRGPGPEIPEFAGNADLHERADPLRSGRDERGRFGSTITVCWSRGTSTWRRCGRRGSSRWWPPAARR